MRWERLCCTLSHDDNSNGMCIAAIVLHRRYCMTSKVSRGITSIIWHHRWYCTASQVLYGIAGGTALRRRYSIALNHRYHTSSQVFHSIVWHRWCCMASQISRSIACVAWHHRYCIASQVLYGIAGIVLCWIEGIVWHMHRRYCIASQVSHGITGIV